MDIKKLKIQSKTLLPAVRVGKSGITKGLLGDLGRQLKKKKIIKIKFLKAFVDTNDKKEAAKEIAYRLRAVIVDQIGNTLTIAKKELVDK